jgi:hypothetical protein
LLDQLAQGLEQAKPPDLTDAAAATRSVWEKLLDAETEELAESLVQALEPRQQEIEHHFRVTGQQRFQRLMAGYLGAIASLQQARSRIRNPAGAIAGQSGEPSSDWDVTGLTRVALADAGRRGLQSRLQTLTDRLVVTADGEGFPPELLKPRLDDLAALDWAGQLGSAVGSALSAVERDWARPTGGRAILNNTVVFLANIVPEVVFIGSVILLIWKWTMEKGFEMSLGNVMIPFALTLAVLMAFHVLIHLLLPLRWPAIRGQFLRRLATETHDRMAAAYLPAPAQVAAEVAAERTRVEALIRQVQELSNLLAARRQSAGIDAMYGA